MISLRVYDNKNDSKTFIVNFTAQRHKLQSDITRQHPIKNGALYAQGTFASSHYFKVPIIHEGISVIDSKAIEYIGRKGTLRGIFLERADLLFKIKPRKPG